MARNEIVKKIGCFISHVWRAETFRIFDLINRPRLFALFLSQIVEFPLLPSCNRCLGMVTNTFPNQTALGEAGFHFIVGYHHQQSGIKKRPFD